MCNRLVDRVCPRAAIACNVQNKYDRESYKATLDRLYDHIVKCLLNASAEVCRRVCTADQANCANYNNRLDGWTEFAEGSHDQARQHYPNWVYAGK